MDFTCAQILDAVDFFVHFEDEDNHLILFRRHCDSSKKQESNHEPIQATIAEEASCR